MSDPVKFTPVTEASATQTTSSEATGVTMQDRLAVRVALFHISRTGTPEQRAAVDAIRSDHAKFDDLAAALKDEHASQVGDGAKVNWQGFLDWMLTMLPTIIELINKLIKP